MKNVRRRRRVRSRHCLPLLPLEPATLKLGIVKAARTLLGEEVS